jgi:3-vinyl bacteriochlorophyllide hydratase
MLVLTLHTAYLYFLWSGGLSANELIYLALAAYVAYLINAAQFLWKLRVARYESVADETVVEEERNDRNVSGGMAT